MKNESGITLIALVVTIVILLILSSIGINSVMHTIESVYYTAFVNELKIMQMETNELYQAKKYELGEELTEVDTRKNVLEAEELSPYINDEIKNGFRYFSKEYIEENLKLEEVSRDYLINIQSRKVVSAEPFNYNGVKYYIIDQIDNSYYNVEYNNQNSNNGTFQASVTKDGNKYKVEISNIQYEGYVDNWKVKYKLIDNDFWNTSNDLTFYISEEGIYDIKVIHGDDIDLGTNKVIACEYNNVNSPKMVDGMTPIKFVEATNTEDAKILETISSDVEWYDYDEQKWANVQSKDGSKWVWIPRYAYKIDNTNQIIDVVFLIGKTDYYYNTNGQLQKAQRATKDNNSPNTKGELYTVHPAFTDESEIKFVNGGWDKELTGIWVAKYEAGYQNGTIGEEIKTVKYSDLKYTQVDSFTNNFLTASLTTDTNLSYPVFKANTYSYNIISASDAYLLSKEIQKANIYGLSNTNSHMMKNSEWGAVAYLTHSKYGVNGNSTDMNEVEINSKNLNNEAYVNNDSASGIKGEIYGVTSYGNSNIPNDVKASSTKNMTGVFDLNGGLWERTAGFLKGGQSSNSIWHNAMANSETIESTKYVTLYTENNKIGDATNETHGWNLDECTFFNTNMQIPVFYRGGAYYGVQYAGIFAYDDSYGELNSTGTFRVCLAF